MTTAPSTAVSIAERTVQILPPSSALDGSGALALERALRAFALAALPVELLEDVEAAEQARGPLVLLYPSPDLALGQELLDGESGSLVASFDELSGLASRLSGRPGSPAFRLVNLSLSPLPRLITWALQALTAADGQEGAASDGGPVEPDLWFCPQPDPIDALITLELLRVDGAIQPAYLALEQHPLSAAAEERPPDLAYGQRLQAAASLENLLRSRQAMAGLDQQLRSLGAELGGARSDLIDAAWVREQLGEQIQQMQEQLRVLGLQIEQGESEKQALRSDIRESQEEIRGRQEEIQQQMARVGELQANQSEIQASLEQAVHCSRSQRDMHAAMVMELRALQGQMARLQGG